MNLTGVLQCYIMCILYHYILCMRSVQDYIDLREVQKKYKCISLTSLRHVHSDMMCMLHHKSINCKPIKTKLNLYFENYKEINILNAKKSKSVNMMKRKLNLHFENYNFTEVSLSPFLLALIPNLATMSWVVPNETLC